jgi:hypothetical protein
LPARNINFGVTAKISGLRCDSSASSAPMRNAPNWTADSAGIRASIGSVKKVPGVTLLGDSRD